MTLRQLLIAILLNFFGLPGAGQFYLNHRRRGLILASLTGILLLVFVVHFYQMTAAITATHKVIGFDLEEVYDLMSALKVDLIKYYKGTFTRYLLALVAFYLAGLADLLWLYKKEKPHHGRFKIS